MMLKLHAALWQNNFALAQASLNHPFVESLADGTLAQNRFERYVAQDAFFLRAFAQAYALAAARSPNIEAIQAFHELLGGVLHELKLHSKYAKKIGIDLASVPPVTETAAYTNFLLRSAWQGNLPQILAAMTPCMRLYAYLGQEISKKGALGRDHPYKDWIVTYSSPDFKNLAQRLESLLDEFGDDTSAVHDAYRYAMQCELDFFEAFWRE